MSIGSFGILGSVAATPLAQVKGSEQQAATNAVSHQRLVDAAASAEASAGIGKTDGENHETEERDADGRKLWEDTKRQAKATAADELASADMPLSKDASGASGNSLDLVG